MLIVLSMNKRGLCGNNVSVHVLLGRVTVSKGELIDAGLLIEKSGFHGAKVVLNLIVQLA